MAERKGVAGEPVSRGSAQGPHWLDEEQYGYWRSFVDGTARLNQLLAQDLEKRCGLSLSEYAVLVRLSEAPDHTIRMSELAADLSHSRSRMTHTVRRMEMQELVKRVSCSNDGRGVNCAMTEKGHAALVAAAPQHVEAVRRFFIDIVTPAELATVGDVLGRVAREDGTGTGAGA